MVRLLAGGIDYTLTYNSILYSSYPRTHHLFMIAPINRTGGGARLVRRGSHSPCPWTTRTLCSPPQLTKTGPVLANTFPHCISVTRMFRLSIMRYSYSQCRIYRTGTVLAFRVIEAHRAFSPLEDFPPPPSSPLVHGRPFSRRSPLSPSIILKACIFICPYVN
jgi:hypothetical protein